jgi:hypothetical protein
LLWRSPVRWKPATSWQGARGSGGGAADGLIDSRR